MLVDFPCPLMNSPNSQLVLVQLQQHPVAAQTTALLQVNYYYKKGKVVWEVHLPYLLKIA